MKIGGQTLRTDLMPVYAPVRTPCPRCGIVITWVYDGDGDDGGALEQHYVESCPTMYQERMLSAFLDRLERILAGLPK